MSYEERRIRAEHVRWERMHKDLKLIERSIMALSDAVNSLTNAVNDTVTELRDLKSQLDANGDVAAASEQIQTMADNLESAVTEAKASGGTTSPTDPGTVDPTTGGDPSTV